MFIWKVLINKKDLSIDLHNIFDPTKNDSLSFEKEKSEDKIESRITKTAKDILGDQRTSSHFEQII